MQVAGQVQPDGALQSRPLLAVTGSIQHDGQAAWLRLQRLHPGFVEQHRVAPAALHDVGLAGKLLIAPGQNYVRPGQRGRRGGLGCGGQGRVGEHGCQRCRCLCGCRVRLGYGRRRGGRDTAGCTRRRHAGGGARDGRGLRQDRNNLSAVFVDHALAVELGPVALHQRGIDQEARGGGVGQRRCGIELFRGGCARGRATGLVGEHQQLDPEPAMVLRQRRPTVQQCESGEGRGDKFDC